MGEGRPRFSWCVVWVDGADYSVIDASDQVTHLTAEVLDGPIRNPVRNRIVQQGIMTTSEFTGLSTNRDLLMYLVQKHYPHVTSFEQAFPGVG